MLARLDPRRLGRIWFPLGDQTKEQTRAEAETAGLAAARRVESQEACFLAGDDYRSFLSRQGLIAEPGAIVDESGAVLGPRSSLARTRVAAKGRLFVPADRVTAKLRYRSPAVAATVEQTASGFRLMLDEPAFGVARGQAAVLYDGDVVVGSGLVTSAAAI